MSTLIGRTQAHRYGNIHLRMNIELMWHQSPEKNTQETRKIKSKTQYKAAQMRFRQIRHRGIAWNMEQMTSFQAFTTRTQMCEKINCTEQQNHSNEIFFFHVFLGNAEKAENVCFLVVVVEVLGWISKARNMCCILLYACNTHTLTSLIHVWILAFTFHWCDGYLFSCT